CMWDDLVHCFKRKKKAWRTPAVACPACEECGVDGGCVVGQVETAVGPAAKAGPPGVPVLAAEGVPGKLPPVGFPGGKAARAATAGRGGGGGGGCRGWSSGGGSRRCGRSSPELGRQ